MIGLTRRSTVEHTEVLTDLTDVPLWRATYCFICSLIILTISSSSLQDKREFGTGADVAFA